MSDCAGQDVQHKVRASVPAGEDNHIIKTLINNHQAGLREEVRHRHRDCQRAGRRQSRDDHDDHDDHDSHDEHDGHDDYEK